MRQKEKLEVNFRSKLALPKRTKSGSVWGFKHDCSSTRTNPAGPESFLEKFHYRQKNFQIFENFLWHSTRLGEPEKTALADFLRFFALKKVFWNHHIFLSILNFPLFKIINCDCNKTIEDILFQPSELGSESEPQITKKARARYFRWFLLSAKSSI